MNVAMYKILNKHFENRYIIIFLKKNNIFSHYLLKISHYLKGSQKYRK